MKISKVFFLALFIFFVGRVYAQHYVPVDQSSAVKFKISHVMIFKSTVNGTFKGLKGDILFDPAKLQQSSFNVSVQAATINSGINLRDNDLREEKYFDTDHYKLITIKSQSITNGTNDNSFTFTGTLTMKGTTKAISFPFTAKAENSGYRFSGKFNVNRLEFNVGPDNSIDKTLEVYIDVFAK